ncbi:acyltransferase family protein [Sphingobacterium sp. DN00404]|uniref:Acyltransferase family protein n=1 Tax=Sphingobacterium micropteri TaxID=2763501 RepID=A0ABR7YLN0_9SPHI|nr:acyltransferase family protein [Sphingobacterium micropteri]MBD1432230.1 acyltransferase family protein [Sphingobacterium micropteri]
MKKPRTVTYFGLDLFKFLMAICVVAIHTHPAGTDGTGFIFKMYDSFLKIAVPFFFFTSGYLLAHKLSDDYQLNETVITGFIKKLVKLYLIWTLIYMPLTLYGLSLDGELSLKGAAITLRNILFKGENYFSWPLWYMLSLVYFGLLLWISNRFKWRYEILLIITILIYVLNFVNVNFLGVSYLDTLKKVFGTTRIFSGFVFIALGLFIYQRTLKSRFWWAILALAITLYIGTLSIPLLSDLMVIGAAIAIFFIGCNITSDNKAISSFFRKISIVMFFTHMYFYFLYISFVPKDLHIQMGGFLFSLLATLFLGDLVIKYGDKVNILKTIF